MKNLIRLICLLFIATGIQAQQSYHFGIDVKGTAGQHAILIPGFSCAADVWASTTDQIKSKYTCHLLTMPGFALQPVAGTPDFYQWTKEIARYIRTNKLGKATIIGHSMGGMMALKLAAEYPDLIKEIIVVDALPCLAAMSNPAFIPDENPNCEPVIGMFAHPTEEQFLHNQRLGIAGMCANTAHHDEIISWAVASDKNTLGIIYCQLMNFDARDFIQYIKCPTLILLEANFKSFQDIIAKQYEKLAEADLRYANQGLHFIMYDDTEWYEAQMNEFLKLALK